MTLNRIRQARELMVKHKGQKNKGQKTGGGRRGFTLEHRSGSREMREGRKRDLVKRVSGAGRVLREFDHDY